MARPTKYEPKYHNDWAWSLAILGATDREIAQSMGISLSTLNKWKNDFPEFSDSLKAGKESADAHVERSLYRLATGVTVKRRKVLDRSVAGQAVSTDKQGEEYEIPPNPTAIIFWLKNRQPQKWRDRREEQEASRDGIEPNMGSHWDRVNEYFTNANKNANGEEGQ
ncbi:MAG: hypothetical protein IJG38_02230 [Thermoguttaceae bacterium]|nr:hypothetical protein [Thermoguttaceae bacterium]